MRTIEETYLDLVKIPSDIWEHLPILRRYGEMCERIVELGVRNGASTIALLSSAPEKMWSYDIVLTNRAKDIHTQANLEGLDFELIEGNSITVEIPECDLLFIDTLHVDSTLIAELYRHSEKVRKYIILHDTVTFALIGGGEQGPIIGSRGLMYALIEFLVGNADHWRVKDHFTNNNGLTILERI